MSFFGLRSMTATALSLWLGILACLLGCVKPAAGSTSTERSAVSETGMGVCPEGNSGAGDACCQHGLDAPDSPEKNSHHAKSCCPTETALTQKKSVGAAPLVTVHAAALKVTKLDTSEFVFASISVPTLCRAGRDILREVHVLRI
jgi:hypothetical protein